MLLSFFIAVTAIVIAAGVYRNRPAVAVSPETVGRSIPANSDVSMKKVVFSEVKNGAVVWEMVAQRVDYDNNSAVAFLYDITMKFHRNLTQIPATVTADRGEYRESDKTVRLEGNVYLLTDEGGSFETSTVLYNGVTSGFTTSTPVRFRQGRLDLAAVGLDFDLKSGEAVFKKSIDASVSVK